MMRRSQGPENDEDPRADDDPPDDDELLGWDTESEVVCPYCGEGNTISLDPGGGRVQTYVEDCQVCCQPWRVHVEYGRDGGAVVQVDAD